MALAKDLLTQAQQLASKEPKKPRQASLRRAISTGYYALFHLLVSEGALKFAPGNPPKLRARVQRAFVQGTMRNVCSSYRGGMLPVHLSNLCASPLEPELQRIADCFVQLQEARHSADYDTAENFEKNDVLQKLDLVEQAFGDWDVVKDKPNATVFLAALLLNDQWKR